MNISTTLLLWQVNEMRSIPGIKIYGDPNNKDSAGAISFLHETIQSQDLAILLDEGGFAVRTGIIALSHSWMRWGYHRQIGHLSGYIIQRKK